MPLDEPLFVVERAPPVERLAQVFDGRRRHAQLAGQHIQFFTAQQSQHGVHLLPRGEPASLRFLFGQRHLFETGMVPQFGVQENRRAEDFNEESGFERS